MDWHARYVQQAGWTEALRDYLFRRAGLERAGRVLEVGCGTGAILMSLERPGRELHGLDREAGRLAEARRHAPSACLACGDARSLPYPPGSFDLVCCHYLLLWVADPIAALAEMRRVTRPGGAVLALAEPDHSARLDRPAALAPLGRLQTEALRRQGADPGLGGRLAELFARAGLPVVEAGSLRPGAQLPPSPQTHALEWAVLESDLAGSVPPAELARWRKLDRQAWADGSRVLFVPTFYAFARA